MIKKRFFLLSLAASSLLAAATPVAPTTGDILRQTEPPKLPEQEKALPAITPQEYKAPLAESDAVTVAVKGFGFSGNTAFDDATLAALVREYEGKELGINGLKGVASVVTKYYRDRGYFVARAYIPKQTMAQGVVEIAVVEGAYGTFEMKNSSLVATEELQSFMDHLKQGQVVSTMSLERQMLLINDLSGAVVTNAEIYPGEAVGSSDFRITVAPTPRYSAYAVVDNYGIRYTGDYRLSVGGSVNSPTGVGDNFSIGGLISNTADLKNARMGYKRPLGYSGLEGGVSGSLTKYELSKELTTLYAHGQTDSFNAYLSYPFVRTRAHTFKTDLDLDYRNMKESMLGSEAHKRLTALTLRATEQRNTSWLGRPGIFDASLGVTAGDLSLRNAAARTNDLLLDSEGNFAKLTFDAYQQQSLFRNTSLKSYLRAQKSIAKNLDSSEDISVGGSNGVRSYEESELSGDQGYVLSVDLVYALPAIGRYRHDASLFVDHATVWTNSKTFNLDDNRRTINAVGLGYGAHYGHFDLKATLAHGFGSERAAVAEAGVTTNSNKLLVQAIARF